MTEKEKKTLREAIIIIQGLLDSGQLDLFGEKKSNERIPERFTAPTKEQVREYFLEKGYTAWRADEMWEYYEALNWCDSHNNTIKSWKHKALNVWMTPEHRLKKTNGFDLWT